MAVGSVTSGSAFGERSKRVQLELNAAAGVVSGPDHLDPPVARRTAPNLAEVRGS